VLLAVIVAGRIVASGAPDTIGGRDRAAATIRFSLPAGAAADLPVPGAKVQAQTAGYDHIEICSDQPSAVMAKLTSWASQRGVELGGLSVAQPSLEDIYLQLTAEAEASLP